MCSCLSISLHMINGCIEVHQGVFTAVGDNEDDLNIIIRPKNECPAIS